MVRRTIPQPSPRGVRRMTSSRLPAKTSSLPLEARTVDKNNDSTRYWPPPRRSLVYGLHDGVAKGAVRIDHPCCVDAFADSQILAADRVAVAVLERRAA